jgi:hypothetical protein
MEKNVRENSVRSLSNIYTVVIGVAVSIAVAGVIDKDRGLSSVTWSSGFLFIAFVVTLLPFCHGALLHLDRTYFDASKEAEPGALIIDFVLLFFHALAFVVLAVLLKNPPDFAWVLVVVLLIDVVWGIFAHFSRSEKNAMSAPGRWALINFVFVGLGVLLLYTQDIGLGQQSSPKIAFVVLIGCAMRTLVDYAWCKSFYFPTKEAVASVGK